MPIRKFLKDQARKAVLWALEQKEDPSPEQEQEKSEKKAKTTLITPYNSSTYVVREKTEGERIEVEKTTEKNQSDHREKATLMLMSLLLIHEFVWDANIWQGYEARPEQLDQIREDIYTILQKHPHLETVDAGDVLQTWLEDYALFKKEGFSSSP